MKNISEFLKECRYASVWIWSVLISWNFENYHKVTGISYSLHRFKSFRIVDFLLSCNANFIVSVWRMRVKNWLLTVIRSAYHMHACGVTRGFGNNKIVNLSIRPWTGTVT